MLPDGIRPNEGVDLSGFLKAFIRHETEPRAPGHHLCVKKIVSLLAYSERLSRANLEFSVQKDITIQYPLRLSPPGFLDCVTKNDQARLSWTVSHILKF